MTTTELAAKGNDTDRIDRVSRKRNHSGKLTRRVALWSASITAFMSTWGILGSVGRQGALSAPAGDQPGASGAEQGWIQNDVPKKKIVVVVRREVAMSESSRERASSSATTGSAITTNQRSRNPSSTSRQNPRPAPVTRSRGS